MLAKKVVAAGVLLGLLWLPGCASPSRGEESPALRVPLTDARSAEVRLEQADGRLVLTGGGVDLLEGEARGSELGSDSRETTAGAVATVLVRSKGSAAGRWDLRLGGGLPTDILATLGSVEASIDLDAVDAKDVAIDSSGTVNLSLAGPHPSLSSFAATATGPSAYALTGEYPALDDCRIVSASGGLALDLAGPWHKDLVVHVTSLGAGDVVLTLPRTVNLNIVSKATSDTVTAEGLTPAADGWTFTAEKPVPYTLGIRLVVPTGTKVDLKLKQAG